ncbi:type II secretion system F family protein [Actinopolymorpha rutila]|uniref:Tight adherence protein B n=1 Tax=Actinopolymorpha rutila TaxID=446787 RepID=A0A852ZJ49_9ACTN|nr:type II secretion system F family protein [Actinopolymorpha rutila]NYH92994.1 tight adherence protein B [Actinopolymorpha rutila]
MSSGAVVAACLVGLAVAVCVPAPPSTLLRRLYADTSGAATSAGGGRPANGGSGSGSLARGGEPLGRRARPLQALVVRLGARWSRRKDVRRRRAALWEATETVAAELRAGRSADQALAAAAGVLPDLAPAAAVSRMGGDVPAALRAVSAPGTAPLRRLAVAWSVAGGTGAGLAVVLERIAHGMRAEERLREEVAGTLAAPRATARMLAVMPLLGLALGAGVGANPLTFLLRTPYGLGCLLLGTLLAATGVWWVERLAARAEGRP